MKPGEKIAILRHKKSLSVTDIAMKLDISSYDVMDWEDGKKEIPDNYLYPLCSLLGISITDFLDNSYIVEDDVVNHEDDEPQVYEEPVYENPVDSEPLPSGEETTPITPIRDTPVKPTTPKSSLYNRYRRIVIFMRIVNLAVVILFATLLFVSMGQFLPTSFIWIWGFFLMYFIMMFFIFSVSTGVKEYEYKGHEILMFYMFVVNRAFVDGTSTKITVIPGMHKGEAALGWIEVGGEKLHWGAHKLYTENGEEIPPK